ncbi:UNVERIFIED_CONTAM: hypothetical protein RMT77_016468 [Armadillidium vulgare]
MRVILITINFLCLLSTTVHCINGIFRTDSSGENTLIEYNVFGSKFGICSYSFGGQKIDVEYEEANGVLRAQSAQGGFEDPLSRAIRCRRMAARFPAHNINNISPFNLPFQSWVTGARKGLTPGLGDKDYRVPLRRSPKIEGTYSPWGFSFGGIEKTGTNNFPQYGLPSWKSILAKLIYPGDFEPGTPVTSIDLTV